MLYDAGGASLYAEPEEALPVAPRAGVIRSAEYTFTAEDAAHVYRENIMRWVDYYFLLSVYIFFPLLVVPLDGVLDLSILVLVLPVVLIGVWPYWRVYTIRRANQRVTPLGITLEFDDRFITTTISDGSGSRFELKTFLAARVTDKFLYLYVAHNRFISIPRRAFTEHEFARVQSLLRTSGLEIGTKRYRAWGNRR